MFLRNVGDYLQLQAALQPREKNVSVFHCRGTSNPKETKASDRNSFRKSNNLRHEIQKVTDQRKQICRQNQI
jgi:hypothetical protein